MPVFETGFFLILLVFACFFTFFGFSKQGNFAGFMHITALALFAGLAGLISAGFEVSATTSIVESTEQRNGTDNTLLLYTNATRAESQILLPGGEDSYWLAWLFSGLSILNLFMMIKDFRMGT